jgi:ADP-ribosylglycohydrolase
MLGLAAGDRNGGPQRMALRLAEAILSSPSPTITSSSELALLRHSVMLRYVAWELGPGKCPAEPERAFDTGQVFGSVVSVLLRQQQQPTASAVVVMPAFSDEDIAKAAEAVYKATDSAGVNAAHRNAAPIACALDRFPTLAHVAAACAAECRLTHVHPQSVNVAVATGVIIRSLITSGGNLLEAVRATLDFVKVDQRDELTAPILQRVASQLANAAPTNMKRPEHRGGHSPLVLEAALYFVATAETFESALMSSLEFAGHPNFCPVLVGAIGGALFGVDQKALDALSKSGMANCDDDEEAAIGVTRQHLAHCEFMAKHPHVKRYLAASIALVDSKTASAKNEKVED